MLKRYVNFDMVKTIEIKNCHNFLTFKVFYDKHGTKQCHIFFISFICVRWYSQRDTWWSQSYIHIHLQYSITINVSLHSLWLNKFENLGLLSNNSIKKCDVNVKMQHFEIGVESWNINLSWRSRDQIIHKTSLSKKIASPLSLQIRKFSN